MKIPEFMGGNDVQRSLNLADNRLVNLYATTDDSGAVSGFYSTPGLAPYASASSPFSGIYTASNGRCFAVSGTILYEVTTGGVLTDRGTVTAATVSKMSDNGIEMILVNGTDGWLFTFATNALKKISVNSKDFTVTIASPAVFTTIADHGLVVGDAIQLTTTTGQNTVSGELTKMSTLNTSGTFGSIVSSADNAHVYIVGSSGINQYGRDPTTGELFQLSTPTVTFSTRFGAVSFWRIKLSPDGAFLYASCSDWNNTVDPINLVIFTRNSVSGELTAVGSIFATPEPGSSIFETSLMHEMTDVGASPSFYIHSSNGNIYQYSRNIGTGAITPYGVPKIASGISAITDITISPDGLGVYVTGYTGTGSSQVGRIQGFLRNATTGLLTALTVISDTFNPTKAIISSDSAFVYVGDQGSNTIRKYSRNLTTSVLTYVNSVSCGTPQELAISSDGTSVYAMCLGKVVYQYDRNTTTGDLTPTTTPSISTDYEGTQVSLPQNGKNLYITYTDPTFLSGGIMTFARQQSATNVGLPTGLETLTTYYVIAAGLTAKNFEVSLTEGGAAVNTSGVQAGIHTYSTIGYGFPDGCKTVSYIDGRFVVCEPNTQNFYVSDVLKGGTWDALNVQTADSSPDKVIGQVTLHNELIVFCEQSGETFYDSGTYPSPFVRNVSGIFEVGCIAPYSISKIDNSVMWLGRSSTGQGIIYRLNGYTPVRLSTYAIEYAIQNMSTISDAQAFTYQQEGHHFYVITFPTGGRTFAFDVNTSLWHERQSPLSQSATIGAWTSSATTISSFQCLDIAYNGSTYCAVGMVPGGGTTNTCYTSTDGVVWTARTLPQSGFWDAVAWNGTVFCAISGLNNLSTVAATSPDGITWTQRTLPANAYWSDIIYANGVFCAIAYFSTVAATSPDGITWAQRVLPSGNWKSISWNGSVFCAISMDSNVSATSPDGITWTARTLPASAFWQSISWNGTVFCAIVGSNPWASSSSTIAATSPDGITWTQRTLPETVGWSSISSIGSVFCIVNATNNNAYISTDGISWTLSAIPGAAGTFYAIGNNGSIFCAIANTAVAYQSGAISITTTYGAWEGREYAYFDGKHLVTDSAEGKIYSVDLNTYTDGGLPRKWIRSFRAPPSEMKRVIHNKLTLEAEVGVGNISAPNPIVSLKYSNDGGHTWSADNWRDLSMGTLGQYSKRVYWYRLGMTTGQTRLYELSSTSPTKVALLGAYLE